MRNSTRNILVDLVLDNALTNGEPDIRPEDRQELENYLTHVLVNNATRRRHCDTLNDLKLNRSPVLPAGTVTTITNKGLDALTSKALASFALNPKVIINASQRIKDEHPEAWTQAVKEEGVTAE